LQCELDEVQRKAEDCAVKMEAARAEAEFAITETKVSAPNFSNLMNN
jgi:hypothetical protein